MTIDDALRFIEHIYGQIAPCELAKDYVREARERLGIALPTALLSYYERTGRAHALHHAHNELVPPKRIDFAGEHLVIYEENQRVVVWGIHRDRLGDVNPAVDQGQANGDAWEFHAEFASLAHFASAQAAWQAVQGALPYSGVLENHAQSVAARLGAPHLTTTGLRAWLVERGVCVDAGGGYLALATHTAEAFTELSQRLGLQVGDWDWATLQDE